MNETDFYPLLQSLQKYLLTSIEVSRGTKKITVPGNKSPYKYEQTPDRIVEYDCHDVEVLISNTAPIEP